MYLFFLFAWHGQAHFISFVLFYFFHSVEKQNLAEHHQQIIYGFHCSTVGGASLVVRALGMKQSTKIITITGFLFLVIQN